MLYRDFIQTIKERVAHELAFASTRLNKAIALFLNDKAETARLTLRDLVNATIGLVELALKTAKPCNSLHLMLSAKGNRTMD